MIRAFLIFLILLFVGSASAQPSPITKKDVKNLASAMAGEFSSEEQSKTDADFFHIKLRMKPIWSDKKNGHWFYVEQSAAESQDKPYRQRIYRLFRQDGSTVVSKVYEIDEPSSYIGAWKDDTKLKGLSEKSLIERRGCSIYLKKNMDGTYTGSTPGKECLSLLRGATYATSEVTIFADKLISWDRGWDKDDKQVWGAVKGGYIFKKKRNF